MTRYPLSARCWTTGPNGVSISVIPGRTLVAVYEEEELPSPGQHYGRGVVCRHIIGYLTEHGSATPAGMAAGGIVSQKAIRSCLAHHPNLFVSRTRDTSQHGAPKLWRLRGAP